MGKQVCKAGMTVKFYDDQGQKVSSRFYSKGRFTGKKVPPHGPNNPGSDDWLHDIHLADSAPDLDTIIASHPAETNDAYTTSGCSVGARLIMSETVNGKPHVRECKDQYVIATNLDASTPKKDKFTIVDTLMVSSKPPFKYGASSELRVYWDKEIGHLL